MKKSVVISSIMIVFLGLCSLHADHSSGLELGSNLGLSVLPDQSFESKEMVEGVFGSEDAPYRTKGESYSTGNISYQYTTDGWLQHVGVYPGSVICTNVAGPREGVQFIIANNGALFDMCQSYTKYHDHFTNAYSWGEVNTYSNYQIVIIY